MRGNEARIIFDWYDISGDTTEFEISTTIDEIESAVLTSTGVEYSPLQPNSQLSINGYLGGIQAGFEHVLNSTLDDGTRHVALILNYSSIPAISYIFERAFLLDRNWSGSVSDLLTLNGTVKGRGGAKRGACVYYNEGASATGAETGVQVVGIANNDNGRVFFFLHTATGITGNVVVDIQSSIDGVGSWTTIATFSLDEVRSDVDTTITYTGPYIRANITNMGGASAITYSVIVVDED